MKQIKGISLGICVFLILGVVVFLELRTESSLPIPDLPKPTPIPTTLQPTPTPTPIPQIVILDNDYHIFQSFNNCGPASLSMALSYHGVNISQESLGQALRPYQNISGDNDDKSVTLEELAEKSKDFDLIPYHRPAGDETIVKKLIALGLPVLTRTTTKPTEDIGHYRVIKGYDNLTGEFIQDDSLQGHNLRYSYQDFKDLWQTFNYEFLVLTPPEKDSAVKAILGNLSDPQLAWSHAQALAQAQLQTNPNDIFARFNLAVAYYYLGNYPQAVAEYETVAGKLPFRTLWYQIEPLLAYYEQDQYDKVFRITDSIFERGNRAYSEAYLIRGQIYENQGQLNLAREEYQKAVTYNQKLETAIVAFSQFD